MCYGYSFIVCFEHRHRRQTRRAWTDKKKKRRKIKIGGPHFMH